MKVTNTYTVDLVGHRAIQVLAEALNDTGGHPHRVAKCDVVSVSEEGYQIRLTYAKSEPLGIAGVRVQRGAVLRLSHDEICSLIGNFMVRKLNIQEATEYEAASNGEILRITVYGSDRP